MSIIKSVFTISVFSVITRLLGFLLRIYLSREIGAEALGIYQVALSVFMVLLTFVTSGLTLIISRRTASYRVTNSKEKIAKLSSTSLLYSLVLSSVLCLVIFVFRNLFSGLFSNENCMQILIILLPSLIFSSVYSVFRGVMWGYDNYFALCVTEFFEQVIKIAFCVLLIGTSVSAIENATSVAWAFTLSCLFSAILVVLLFFFYGGSLAKPAKEFSSVITQSAPITLMRTLGSFVQPLVALILPAKLVSAGYTSSQAMSIYGIAMGMTFPLLFLPSTLIGSLSTALVPDISMALAKNNTKHIQNRVSSAMFFTLFITFLIVPIYVAIGDRVGIFLYGEALSGRLLEFSAWIMIPMGISNITSSILNSVGMEVKAFVSYVIGGVFTFVSIIFLTDYFGVMSLVFGIGVSFSVTACLNLVMLKRKLKIETKIIKPIVCFSLISLPTVAITSFLSAILSYVLPEFFNIAISAGIGVGVFVLLCFVFNLINFQTFKIYAKENIQKLKNSKKIKKKA